jgi:Uncharacterized protein conserved in bacteria (DUF2252)
MTKETLRGIGPTNPGPCLADESVWVNCKILNKRPLVTLSGAPRHDNASDDLIKCGVLNPLNSLSANQRSWLRSTASSESKEEVQNIADSVRLGPDAQYRDPEGALTFMADFDAQLGLSEAMQKEKQELMAESRHAFFRASPALFHQDLKTTYLKSSRLLSEPAPSVHILGDAHALNAGTFRGPDGQVVWGLNDFDQAEVGSPEWDLERLGVSLYVAAREDGQSAAESMQLVETMGRSYLAALDEKGPSFLTMSETDGPILELMRKSASETQEKFLKKWTTKGGRELKRDDNLVAPDEKRGKQIEKELRELFPDYKFLDLASKPHSGGSTRGLERYYALVESPDRAEPWILETKVHLPSPVQIPDGDLGRGDGARLIECWTKMGGHTDQRNAAFKLENIAFFTREREKEKGSLDGGMEHLEASAKNLGRVMARAHGRSGADIKGWIGDHQSQFLSNLVIFSRLYGRQVESDFRAWEKRYG